MLKYSLRENLLTADPDDCMGRNLRLLTEFAIRQTRANPVREFLRSKNSVSAQSARHIAANQNLEQEEIIDLMMRRGTTLTKADVTAVLQVYAEVVGELTSDGSAVNTPLFNTSFSVTGVFTSMTDSFDKSRHSVSLNVGASLREAAKSVRTEKVEGSNTDPYITEAQGVFLVPESGDAVRCTVVAENKPARVMVPQGIAPGTYYAEVRTKLIDSTRSGKVVKSGQFGKPLSVAG